MEQDNRNEIAYKNFIPEFLDRIQNTIENYLDDEDIHKAFVYLIADLFETTNEDRFEFTDGAKDGGIDFFIQDANVYSIYQCKCPEYESLDSSDLPQQFDKAPVQESITAVDTILDERNEFDLKPAVARLRTDYQRDLRSDSGDEPVLTVNLAVFGELTPAALNLFLSEKQKLHDKGIDFNLITWDEIFRKMHEFDTQETENIKVELRYEDKTKEVLSQDNYLYMLAYAIDFYEAWRKYEWNLFDLNVRLHLNKSPINKRIIASLKKPKSQKIFHHLNNGITITCKSYHFDNAHKVIRLVDPQIINGCQTVCAIRDAYNDLTPVEQEEFKKRTRLQVKIIRTTDPEFISQIVITTNDQNPMAPRNLKSNSSEQKRLQSSFRELPVKWFYERKDGEWQSLFSAGKKIAWFRKVDYLYASQKRYRIIKNDLLSRVWYSWIGNSEKAVKGGLEYFENDDIYKMVFRSMPNEGFWEEFSSNNYFIPKENLFSPGTPTVHQFLLALLTYQIINSNKLSGKKNRENALSRGVQEGFLHADPITNRITSSKLEQDNYLNSRNEDYKINIMINNMNDIIVELFSFALTRRYCKLDPNTSKKLLELDEVTKYLTSNFFDIYKPADSQDGTKVFGPTYSFLRYVIKQYYYEYKAEINAAPRLKAYLFNRDVVFRLKEKMIYYNQTTKDYDDSWKLSRKTFFDSLPDL